MRYESSSVIREGLMASNTQSAFILRIAPSRQDRLLEALENEQIIIGWANAAGLLDESLDWESFRGIVSDAYYGTETNLRRAGAAGGHLWRFIRAMKPGDLVVVPYWDTFYVAEITGPATYDPAKVEADSAYRRTVRWLNKKHALPRKLARAAMISRMKVQGTSADATDLIGEIQECLALASQGRLPTFQTDLQARLVAEVLDQMTAGRIDDFGFERLIQGVLLALGATDARIVPRNLDKGADLLASFLVAGAFQLVVAVQAKHWKPEPPVGRDVVEQLIRGIEAEAANLGMIVTSGLFSDEATRAATQYFEETGIRIECVDGLQFAKLIVEHGVPGI